jgi:hypothetical protein
LELHLRVTAREEETSFADLIDGNSALSIPLFQRPYRWTEDNFSLLFEDIQSIRDEVINSAFLGVIVSYTVTAGPGRPSVWEIVDGQQRVTTLYLTIMAAVEVVARHGDVSWAADAIETYLIRGRRTGNPVNTKLVPGYADRAQFAAIWERLGDIEELFQVESMKYNPPVPPPPGGNIMGEMLKQYGNIKEKLSRIALEEGIGSIHRIVDIVNGHLSFISITLKDPALAPKIFERLNARAKPITVSDLVRNEIFSRSGENVAQAQHIFTTIWEPFDQSFKASKTDLDKFLFPYGLISNPNVRKAELFSYLRTKWAPMGSPQNIIADLDRYKGSFLALEAGLLDPSLSEGVNRQLRRINQVGKPSVVYSFVMRIIEALQDGKVSEADAIGVISSLESFLFRRALLGIEPTGLHAAFKGLWGDLVGKDGKGEVSASAFRDRLSNKPTVKWPTDEEFFAGILREPLYKKKINRYALGEHERSLKGETASDPSVIEHIAPQTPTDHWKECIGDNYGRLVHTWGNLIPLSEKMNPGVGQKPFAQKKVEFANSKFANARHVASAYSDWSSAVIEERNLEIAAWALTRWPH